MSIDERVITKPNYKQPHNIRVYELPRECRDNPALTEHYRMKTHHKLKYDARWRKSKQSRRMY